MFVCEYDPAFALAVMVFELPAADADADMQAYVDVLPGLDARAEKREGPVLIVEFAAGYPVPNAAWRKRFVEARKALKSRPTVALVTSSATMRAGIRLASWVRPPEFEQRTFATFAEAAEWIGQKRGGVAKVLQKLYAEARTKAAG